MTDVTLPRALDTELERTSKRPDEARRWARALLEADAAGDHAAAYQAAVRAKKEAPRSTRIRQLLGRAAFELEKWHEAAQELLAYRRLTGDRRHDPVIAECYRRQGRPGRALEFLADLRRTDVEAAVWVRAQTVKARALSDNGRPEVATSVLEALRIERPSGDADRDALALLAELRG